MPLLIDGCHRLYKAAVTGRAEIPAFVLTADETLLIRSDAVLGPPRPATASPLPPILEICAPCSKNSMLASR